MGLGSEPADQGATVAQRSAVSVDATATVADSAQPVGRSDSEAAIPDTIDVSSRSSQALRESRGPASAETVKISSIPSTPMDETGMLGPAGEADSAFDIFAEPPEQTVAERGGPSDASADGTDAGDSWASKNLPGFLTAAAAGGKNEPPDYEILGELGRGGMGVVYKARHRRLNRLVALKMIRGAYADDIQIARFKIEAEAVAALRHPNILQIYDIGESNGSPYVALELLEGGSLADRLHGTALPPKQAAEWMVPLVLAMDAAHQAGIVHRDLKSANILFSADGIPKITDFGLAKRLEDGRGPDAHRPGDGNAELHGARAGPGRYQIGRPARRHLRPRARCSTRCSPAGLRSRASRRWRPSSRSSSRSRSRPRACSSACRATSRPSA